MVPFPSLCPNDEGTFLHYLLWERGQALGGKSFTIVGVPLEFLTLRLVYTEPPALCQFQFRISYSGSGSRGSFLLVNPVLVSPDFLNSPISPILEAEFCPVFSPLLRTQEELLIFLSVQLLTCCWDRVVTSKQLISQTRNWKSAVYS